MNVVIYARYSSHSQTEQSIEGQIAVCKEYAKRNNYTIVGEYIDRAVTGTTDNRPEFQKMIEESNKKYFNGVLVYQLDRFARNRYDSAINKNKLKKNNVRVFSAKENISDDASGILMESVLEGMAEYYSAELSQKVKRGMNINAEKCLYNGGSIPLGLKVGESKRYQIDEKMAPTIKKIFDMYMAGSTMAQISDYLNARQIKTSKGNNFNGNAIYRILTNKKYIGIYSYNRKDTPNAIPAIIDEETFYNVQEMLSKNKRTPARAKAKNEYILTTKLFCGHCKEMMIGISGTSHTKKVYNYYMCNGTKKKICDKKNVSKEYIEDIIVNEARNLLTDKRIKQIANEFVAYIKKESENKNEVDRLEKAIENNQKRKQNLLDSLSLCEIESVKKEIFEQIRELQESIEQLETSLKMEKAQQMNITPEEIEFFLYEMKNGDVNEIRYRKLLVTVFINKVYLYDGSLTFIFNIQKGEKNIKLPTIEEIEGSFINENGSPN